MKDDFYLSKSIGIRGEALVAAALRAKGHTVEDLTNNIEARANDIDFSLTKNGITITLEVKNDIKSEITGNVYLETFNINNFNHNCYGWFKYSTADYVCFVQENNRRAHIVNLEELRAYTRKNKYPFPIEALQTLDSYYTMEV